MKRSQVYKKLLQIAFRIWYFVPALLIFSCQDFFITYGITILEKETLKLIENGIDDLRFSYRYLLLLIFLVLGLIVVHLGMFLFDVCNVKVADKLQERILYGALNSKEQINIDKINSHLLSDSALSAQLVTYLPGMLLIPIVQVIGCVSVVLSINRRLALIIIVCISVPVIFDLLIRKKTKKWAISQLKENRRMFSSINRVVDARKEIKTDGLCEKENIEFGKVTDSIFRFQIKQAIAHMIESLVCNIAHIAFFAFVMGWAIFEYAQGKLDLSTVVVMPVLSSGILAGITSLCEIDIQSQVMFEAADRIKDYLGDNGANILKNEEPVMLKMVNGKPKNKIALNIENLSYFYPNGKGVSDISFSVRRNEIICIQGPIGSGKSTILKCILGFLDAKADIIEAFGVNYKDCSSEEWLSYFSVVEQSPNLLKMSVKDNILLGNNEDKDRFEKVLELTGLNLIIGKLDEGIETVVGEKGFSFSGGQQQLLCLARAIYSSAPILVLDEFSSAFDVATDKKMEDLLREITRSDGEFDKTILIVSHKQYSADCVNRMISIS